ncbi:MAG: FtsQ-type POTRA domain-containing protein [Robiginitomaculum sp.]|nr:FtsQ-type POTRA domain-containing protein [Robiginitomaculum sp.]
MAKIGQKKGKAKFTAKRGLGGARRISPLKPGLNGARNWATAQIRGASYSRQKMTRLILASLALVIAVLWGGLWLGGFTPNITSGFDRFTKQKLVNMGFVVKYVDVVGEGRVREDRVREMLGVRPGDYLFDMDIENAQKRIQSLSWVETAVVRRLWPNRIVVHINERRPYALWQSNQKIRVIDGSGTVIMAADIREFSDLPFVVGEGAADQAQMVLDMLKAHPDILEKTEALVYVGERRWDIVFKDGMRILLPEQKPATALQRFDTYNREHGLLGLDLARIDMRVKGRLTLKPNPVEKHRKNRLQTKA